MNTTGKVTVGILAGALAGAILGILFAPDKGTETRRKISQSSKDMTNDVKEKITDFIGTVKDKLDPKGGHDHHEKAEKAKAEMA
jgi:gas vesicle protein